MDHVICGLQGDLVTIPLMLNTAINPADKGWRTPATTLYDKAVGSAFLPATGWDAAVQQLDRRYTTPEDSKWLIASGYFPAGSRALTLVDTSAAADYLERTFGERTAAIVTSLRDIPDAISNAGTCLAGADPFPKTIPKCIIPAANLRWPYSLYRLNRPLITGPISRQMKALVKSKRTPTIGLDGTGKKIQHATQLILARSLEEYLGFCYLHLGITPNLKTVMRPAAYACFVAFQRARGLKASTQLRAAQQVSSAIDFVGSAE